MATKKTAKKRTKKKVAKKKASPKPRPSSPRAKKKKTTKKKKVVRKKPTKQERRATHKVRRKPAQDVAKEVAAKYRLDTRKLSDEEKHAAKLTIIRVLALKGSIREACHSSGIARSTFKDWRRKDDEFKKACEDALEDAADRIEEEAHRRAVDGFERPVIYKGEVVDTYTDYSDSLMSMLLRGNKKEKYKERTEHSGQIGRPMTLDEESKEDVVSSILGMIKNKPDPEGSPS